MLDAMPEVDLADGLERVARLLVQRQVHSGAELAGRVVSLRGATAPPWDRGVARAIAVRVSALRVDGERARADAELSDWIARCEAALPDPEDPRRGTMDGSGAATKGEAEALARKVRRLARVARRFGEASLLLEPALWALSADAVRFKAHAVAIDALRQLDAVLKRKGKKALPDRAVVLGDLRRQLVALKRLDDASDAVVLEEQVRRARGRSHLPRDRPPSSGIATTPLRPARSHRREGVAPPLADATVLVDGAAALRRAGLEAEARRAYGELVERAPNDPSVRAFLGDRLRAEGWPHDAHAAYAALEELATDEPATLLRLALAHAQADRFDISSRILQRLASTGGRSGDPQWAGGKELRRRRFVSTATFTGWTHLKARIRGLSCRAERGSPQGFGFRSCNYLAVGFQPAASGLRGRVRRRRLPNTSEPSSSGLGPRPARRRASVGSNGIEA